MTTEQWTELIRGMTLALSALGTVFGGLISVRQFNQSLKIADLERRVETLQNTNFKLSDDIVGLKAIIQEYTIRLNTSIDLVGTRNTELAKGVEALSGAAERIEKLRAVITKDGSRETLDAGLAQDDKDMKAQEGK